MAKIKKTPSEAHSVAVLAGDTSWMCGRQLLSAAIASRDITEYRKLGLCAEYFKAGLETDLYGFIKAHLAQNGCLPHAETIEAVPALSGALVEVHEPASFFLKLVETRFEYNTIYATLQQAMALMPEKHIGAVKDVLFKSMMVLSTYSNRGHMLDMRHMEGPILDAYNEEQSLGALVTLPFGWPTLDNQTGGIREKDFVSMVGKTSAGKSFMLLNIAMNAWKLGRSVLLVSMEMSCLQLAQRGVAMHAKAALTEMTGFPAAFHIVDSTDINTVDELLALCHELNPSLLVIDGAYLMDDQNSNSSKWDKQAQVARDLKRKIAMSIGTPVLASHQLHSPPRDKDSKKPKNKTAAIDSPAIEDLYGSKEIAQMSDILLAMTDDDSMVESTESRTIHILKDRAGAKGKFKINFDLSAKMDFSEVVPENPEDISFNVD